MTALQIPWKLVYSKRDVLTSTQVATLLERTKELSPDQIPKLNEVLNRALWRYLVTAEYGQVKMSLQKGRREFEMALKSIDAACRKLDDAIAILHNLDLRPKDTGSEPNHMHRSLMSNLETSRTVCGRTHLILSRDRRNGMIVSTKKSGDARRVQDIRREMVCEALIQFWRETGHNDGYSSNIEPGGGENSAGSVIRKRGGPLVRFIRDVVEMVTDPPTVLAAETIKKEISISRQKKAARERAGLQAGIDAGSGQGS